MTEFLFVPGQDLQLGLKQGLVAPETLESFFELEQNPIMAELTGCFQVSLARIRTFELYEAVSIYISMSIVERISRSHILNFQCLLDKD